VTRTAEQRDDDVLQLLGVAIVGADQGIRSPLVGGPPGSMPIPGDVPLFDLAEVPA
jgi:hypothetical protein